MYLKSKNNYILLILIVLVGISIGYAALNSSLNINGKSTISKNTWNVYFDNINITDGSVETVEDFSISDDTILNFVLDLNLPGDFFEFTVDVVNDGTIDAMIESFTKTLELTEVQAKYFNYTITYENGEEITNKQLIKKEESVRLKVKVEYKKDITASDLPTDMETLTLSLAFNYVQADETAINVNNNGFAASVIQFTINHVGTFYAEEGMTWEEWIYSEYNINNFEIVNNNTSIYLGGGCLLSSSVENRLISPDEEIIADYTYSVAI